MNNLGQFKLGHIPWGKGKTKENYPQLNRNKKKGCVPWNKGIPMTNEQKDKLREAMTGKKHTEETKKEYSRIRKGKNNPNWKGGITPLILSCRTCDKYKNWRKDIFTRDNYTCQECGKIGGNLEAHHIDLFSKFFYENNIQTVEEALELNELWDINNGRTLCVDCHKKKSCFYGNQFTPTNTNK